MKINKYLKELGLEWYDMPGVYDKKLNDIGLCDKAAADPRNEENEEGFCGYEFFSLDYTLSLFIYSKLCYFREHIADISTPGCLCTYSYSSFTHEEREYYNKVAHNKWLSIVDKMILAFKLKITGIREGFEGIDRAAIQEGMHLFAEYYDCLWY